jgi:hypothetical protein
MMNNYTPSKYVNGFDESILARPRDKAKETVDTMFSSVVPADVWKDRVLRDPSLRMYKSLEVHVSTMGS